MNLSHLRTMLWLRWRLSHNQWRRGGSLNAVLMLVVVAVGLTLAAVGSIAGFAWGLVGLTDSRPEATMFVFDGLVVGFLIMWTIGLITELQRSELLDLTRFLHLPVALRDVFLLNYLASLLSFSMVTILPVMLGLTLGLALGRGVAMLLLLPLVLGFFFMITAWTYWVRGWLAALMVNKRRRQAIVMGVTLALILLSQLPNLAMNVWSHPGQHPPIQTPEAAAERTERLAKEGEQMAIIFRAVHQVVPLLWLPNGARGLAEGQVWPALWGALGMIAIGSWGFGRAYRGAVRFYQGVETRKPLPVSNAAKSVKGRRTNLVERNVPFFPQQAGTLGLATLRSMSRAPEVKMALTVNVVIFGVMGAGALLRGTGPMPAELRPFVVCGAVAVTFMGLTQLMFNHFGFDRNGFRALMLLPTPRHYILLGKNLALSVVATGMFSVFLVLVTVLARLGFVEVVAALFEFAAVFLFMSVLGNLTSTLVPYRIAAGSKKPTKTSILTGLMIFVSHLTSILVIPTILLPPLAGMLIAYFYPVPAAVATLLSAVLLTSLAALLYWRTLAPLGRLLERRGTKILEMVTQEVE